MSEQQPSHGLMPSIGSTVQWCETLQAYPDLLLLVYTKLLLGKQLGKKPRCSEKHRCASIFSHSQQRKGCLHQQP